MRKDLGWTLLKVTFRLSLTLFNLIENIGKKQDDLVSMLGKEPDFAATKPELQEVLEAMGCKVLFGVKFHREMLMIESCYR